MKSTYDVAGWKTTFQRMWNWASVERNSTSLCLSPVPQGAWRFGITEAADLQATDEEYGKVSGLDQSELQVQDRF